MTIRRSVGVSVAGLALLFCASFQTLNLDAQQININFDTDASGNPISAPAVFSLTGPLTSLYAPLGVTFSGPGAGEGGAILSGSGTFGVSPISGDNFLAFNPATYAADPETISFATAMSSVSIYGASGYTGEQFTMKAYSASDALLGSDTITLTANTWGQLDVTESGGIRSVTVSASGGAAAWVYDNLSATPAPEPSVLALMGAGAVALIGWHQRAKAMAKRA